MRMQNFSDECFCTFCGFMNQESLMIGNRNRSSANRRTLMSLTAEEMSELFESTRYSVMIWEWKIHPTDLLWFDQPGCRLVLGNSSRTFTSTRMSSTVIEGPSRRPVGIFVLQISLLVHKLFHNCSNSIGKGSMLFLRPSTELHRLREYVLLLPEKLKFFCLHMRWSLAWEEQVSMCGVGPSSLASSPS
eukprot:TRINITY_DN27104_c0_g1_i2.p1 TRINITY_DN27104_c0_g1~~TRINITY_DN27104_c0_g1_i2.p1  ORF type:complete len:189 (-),score=24.32 TRINITY_DN27104_c0_g1_i2:318-884(-)